jgi:RecB family endonuclease NucS
VLKTILNPTSKDSLAFIEKHHKSKVEKTMLLLIGDCMVDYRGRAQSILDWGERIVMIKQDGNVLVHPPEKMKITFRNLKMIIATSLRDNASLVIAGMELDVVNQIVSEPDIIEDGLRIIKREKHVKSGMIDLFCYDKNHTPTIIEVKRSIANISAVHQLRMYVTDIKKDVKEANVRGILCAPHVPDMVKHLLSDYDLEWREVERKVVLPDDWQKTLKDF